MTVAAVDPGASGGFAVETTSGEVKLFKMPDTCVDLLNFCQGLKDWHQVDLIYMEKVGFHRQGNSAGSSAKFARHCGQLEMALLASGIPIVDVVPSKWMKEVMSTVPTDRAERKRFIKEFVQRRYPSLKITLDTADALGILMYALERRGKDETGSTVPK